VQASLTGIEGFGTNRLSHPAWAARLDRSLRLGSMGEVALTYPRPRRRHLNLQLGRAKAGGRETPAPKVPARSLARPALASVSP
jgi:hypothetical protein